jgi:hypothetical protein
LKQIPDDPQIRSAEKTGYPTWWHYEMMEEDDDDFDGDGEAYYGNEPDSF